MVARIQNIFEVGDLVLYAPYFEGEGAWVMSGDLGIAVNIKIVDNVQIIRVRWINSEMDESDMAAAVLVKVRNNETLKRRK